MAQGITKHFKGLVAVSDVSFAVGPGVTALLGPNGAGKSTALRMLSGQSPPSSGTVWVAGGNPRSSPDARRQIGIVPQQDGVFEQQTAFEFVRLAAVLNHLENPDDAARSALAQVELDPGMTKTMGSFSKGMRQRAKIASAIVHDPSVLFLDEPLNGLDPSQRRRMIALFHHFGEAGKTVIVSSHILEEVQRFGTRVIVIVRGRLAAQGDFREIRGLMDDQPLRFRITVDDPRRLAALLLQSGILRGVTVTGDRSVDVVTDDAAALRAQIARVCQQHDLRLEEFVPLDADLDSVFRYLVGVRG